jgi:hypothetical protein
MKRLLVFGFFGLCLFLLGLSDLAFSGNRPVWVATVKADSLTTFGVPERVLIWTGRDTNGDGKADRLEKILKDDKNFDGDFDDPGETTVTSSAISGDAEIDIDLDDQRSSRSLRIMAEDTDGDGTLDRILENICDITQAQPGTYDPEWDLCYPDMYLAIIDCGGEDTVGITRRYLVPHPSFGCEGPPMDILEGIAISPWMGSGYSDQSLTWGGARVSLDGDANWDDAVASDAWKPLGSFRGPSTFDPDGETTWRFPGSAFANVCRSHAPDSVTFEFEDFNRDGNIDICGGWVNAYPANITGVVKNVQPVILPQFGNGPGIVSTIVIEDRSQSETINGELFLRGDDGKPLQTGFVDHGNVSSIDFTIPPGGKVNLVSDGNGSQLAIGSVWIYADGPISVVERFAITGIGIAGVGGRAPLEAITIPVRGKGALRTGVAYTNAVGQAIEVEFILKELSGDVVDTTDRSLAAFGHDAKFINELFPAVDTSNFEGTLDLVPDFGSIVGEALELGTQAGEFTSLPVSRRVE